MRVTSSMYYDSIYGTNNNKLSKELFDVNKQISSGLSIQYASDNLSTFTETMRLDNELTSLTQIKQSVESGNKVSTQTDDILGEFTSSLERFRTLMLSASNGTNDEISLDAIALELRGTEEHLKQLANTSINGQYLFSGSAIDVKPINDDGTYNGNSVAMNSFAGSSSLQQYNITGAELFLGEESLVNKSITTNVSQVLNNPTDATDDSVSGSSTMEEFMGNSPSGNHYFYMNGVKSDGSAFATKIPIGNSETVDELLNRIGYAYGNTANLNVVNVSMTGNGNIVVEDKLEGSSKLDFHLVGATDFNPDATDSADVTNIDLLDTGLTDYTSASSGSSLYVREFIKSGFSQADSVGTTGNNIEGLLSDRTEFSISGNKISSNVSQINKETNAFASPSTKISEVADTTQGTLDSSDDGLDGTSFKFVGTTISGSAYDVDINFLDTGSQFSIGGNTYDIFNIDGSTPADDVSYQQLMDVMNMVITENLPAANTAAEYSKATAESSFNGETSLSYDGKIQFTDLSAAKTKATIALHDANSGDFTLSVDKNGDSIVDSAKAPVMAFNSNNSLIIRDSKTDFFKRIDEMITAIEDYKTYPDASSGTMRSVGMDNALSMMNDVQDHLLRTHSKVGAQSNALESSLERASLLEITTMSLRSSVLDTDLAEAALSLTKLTLNYEAMLSTVSRVSQLSLVNYL